MSGPVEDKLRLELSTARGEFEDLFGAIRSILIMVGADGTISRWSDAATAALGLSSEWALGKRLNDLPIEWDADAILRAADLCVAVQMTARLDELEVTLSGRTTRTVGLTFSPCKAGGVLVLGEDITYRKLEERILLEKERFYRSIVDGLQDVIFETDADGRWTFLNPAYEAITGQSANEATGRHAFDWVDHCRRMQVLRKVLPLVKGRASSARFDVQYRRANGELGWVEVRIEAQIGESGELTGTFGTIREISERRRNEELELELSQRALRETESRVETIIENAPLIVFSIDREGVLTFCEGNILEKFGLDAQSTEGKSVFDLLAAHPSALEAITQALGGAPSRAEVQIGDIHLQVSYSPIIGGDGRPDGATGVAIDVTESHRLEAQLVHARKMESIGHLAAGLAHEVNTPTQYVADNTRFVRDGIQKTIDLLASSRTVLLSIGGEASAAFERRWAQDDMEYLVAEIPAALDQNLEGLDRVAQIVKSMKQFSHPGTRDFQWADLNEQIQSTVTVSRNEWKYVAEIDLQLDPRLPKAWCAPADLNQVVLNMIVNASHAVTECVQAGKYGLGTISILTQARDGQVEITVRDDGDGIPREIREKIFDPFFTTKDPGKGTGQGLALAHSVVVEMHRGKIDLETSEGKGTAFKISIPIGCESDQPILENKAA